MTIGVVIPCYRQERFLPRTVAALEAALAGRDWQGVLVLSSPDEATALPELSARWQVLRPGVRRPLTPGAARNRGFAACGGAWVLFADADVELQPDWIARVLAEAERADAQVAGYWGRLEEWFVDGARQRPGARDMYRVGDGDHESPYLATLALYRRDALARAGAYDPRLNSEEDFELGLRLRAHGFRLYARAPLAAKHWSAPRPSFAEIGRRWRTGLCFGQGQALRLARGPAEFAAHARRQAHYFATLALWLAAPALAAAAGARGLGLWALALAALFAFMTVRKRDPRLAAHSLLTWTVNAAGMVVGFARGGARADALDWGRPA
ncbi:MAG: glycosyltransferase [Candidatus Eisenbacteria bacterium]